VRAINDATAVGGRSPIANDKEKNTLESTRDGTTKRGRAAKEGTGTGFAVGEVEDGISLTQKHIASKTPPREKSRNPAFPADRLSEERESISDAGMAKSVVDNIRNSIRSDPSAASQAHASLTPQKVLQLIG
jgi:hypothetical protein